MGKRIRGIIARVLASAILLAGIVWAVDWLLLWHKVSANQDAFGAVLVHYRYAVHLKNRRIEQRNEKPHMQECVHSLFSHYDDTPCWYLARHADETEDLNGGQWHLFTDQ